MANNSVFSDLLFGVSSEAKKQLIDKINKALGKIDQDLKKTRNSKIGSAITIEKAPAIETKQQKEAKNKNVAKILGSNSIYAKMLNRSK